MTIIIPGPPIAKKRPRFAKRGNFATTYSEQVTEEGRVYLEIRQQWGARAPIEGPVEVSFLFVFPVPKSASKKARAAMLDGSIPHTKKPDLDNCIKFYKDVANGLIWRDDCQVFNYRGARKIYGEQPRTEIAVY